MSDDTYTADDYRDDLIVLVESFEYEMCYSCGGDLPDHVISPDPLGKPHLWCATERAT